MSGAIIQDVPDAPTATIAAARLREAIEAPIAWRRAGHTALTDPKPAHDGHAAKEPKPPPKNTSGRRRSS